MFYYSIWLQWVNTGNPQKPWLQRVHLWVIINRNSSGFYGCILTNISDSWIATRHHTLYINFCLTVFQCLISWASFASGMQVFHWLWGFTCLKGQFTEERRLSIKSGSMLDVIASLHRGEWKNVNTQLSPSLLFSNEKRSTFPLYLYIIKRMKEFKY